MQRTLATRITLAVLLATLAAAADAQDGMGHPSYNEPGSNETLMDRSDLGNVAQTARIYYAEGQRELKKAVKLEKKLAGEDGAKRAETEEKITAAREKAVEKFTEAVRTAPKMLEAYAGLAEAYGLLGKKRERLQVHAAALKVEPGDEDNFRGWASALLSLDLLGDATRAWDHFSETDPAKADILLAEMRGWLERRQTDPGELAAEDIERMAAWLAEHG